MIQNLFSTNHDLAPLLMRITLAVVIFPHGAQKVLGIWGGRGWEASYQGLAKMGIPSPLIWCVFLAEFAGPIALALGLLTRVAALGIGVIMVVAIVAVHGSNGFFMNWSGTQAGEGFEYHLLALGLALALLLQGGGLASLDGWIAKRAAKPKDQTAA